MIRVNETRMTVKPSHRPTRRRSTRGFTLMELTVVMIILGLTFAVVLPIATNATPGYRLKSAVRTIGSFAESSHAEAVSSSRPFAVVYDLDNREFWTIVPKQVPVEGNPAQMRWVLDEQDEEQRTPPQELPRDIVFQSVQSAAGEEFRSGQRIIRFDTIGNEGSHIVTVAFQDPDEGTTSQPWSVKYNAMTRSLTYREGAQTFYRE